MESTPKMTISADGDDALTLLRKLGPADIQSPRVSEDSERPVPLHTAAFGPIDVIQGSIEFPSSSYRRINFRIDPMNPKCVVITNGAFGELRDIYGKYEEAITDLLTRIQATANKWCLDNNMTSIWADYAYDDFGNTYKPK